MTIKIEIPDITDVSEAEVKLLLAGKLYERGKISLGQAAEISGYSKRAFMEVMGDYGISYFNQSAQDIEKDIKNASSYIN